MKDYFEVVVSSLTIDDMFVLGILLEKEATAAFKALSNHEIMTLAKLTEATYRRIIYRLVANKFIEVISVKKQNALYLTEYGKLAIIRNIEGVGA
jgi:hypothetical protein